MKTSSIKAGSWSWWGEDGWCGGSVTPVPSLPVAPFEVPLPPAEEGPAPGGLATCLILDLLLFMLCFLLLGVLACRLSAVVGTLVRTGGTQGLGALARAAGSSEPGSGLLPQGASMRAGACPDPPLLSSRWVLPQARYLQGQCSLPLWSPIGAGTQRASWLVQVGELGQESGRLQSSPAPGCLGWHSRAMLPNLGVPSSWDVDGTSMGL